MKVSSFVVPYHNGSFDNLGIGPENASPHRQTLSAVLTFHVEARIHPQS